MTLVSTHIVFEERQTILYIAWCSFITIVTRALNCYSFEVITLLNPYSVFVTDTETFLALICILDKFWKVYADNKLICS